MKADEDSIQPEAFDPKLDPESMADDLLVDAMLQGRYQDTAETTAERIERATHALEGAPRVVSLRWKTGLSTVAAAVLILGLILILTSPQGAQADLDLILEAFDQGDKTYQIDISADTNQPSPSRGATRHGANGRPSFKSPRRGMPARRLDGASLYVRGRRFALVCHTRRGDQITKGYDGRESWMVYPWGNSTASDDPNFIKTEIPDHVSAMLFLDLRDTLRQIEEDYRLAGPSTGTLEGGEASLDYYLAERIRRRGKTPRRIELWIDPLTYELQQVVCTGVHFHGPRTARYTLQITLVNMKPLPENWFTREAHRPPSF